jgi:integrase
MLTGENPADDAHHIIPDLKRDKNPALLTWPELGDVLRSAETARISPAVRMAHRLCAFSAARIDNIVRAEWHEFHLDHEPPMWIIPRAKMKAKERDHDHKVILGPTIAAELRQWRANVGGKGYLFASASKKGRVTAEAVEKVYRETLGLRDKHTPHGWRAAFSTLAKDNGHDKDAVELALDHVHTGEVQRAYDRGERLKLRIELAQWWDAQLAHAQRGADVVPFKTA